MSEAAASRPNVGQTAPDFAVPDDRGQNFRLSEACARSPLVLVFYRGHW